MPIDWEVGRAMRKAIYESYKREQALLDEIAQLKAKLNICYMCNGTGLLQSDEDCACTKNECGCKDCQ